MKSLFCLAAVLALIAPASAAPGKVGKPVAVKPIQINGRVLTPDGKPAIDATVTFTLVEFEKHRALTAQTVKPDADGAFKVMVDPKLTSRVMPIFYAASPTGVAVAQPRGMTMTMTLHPFTQVRVRLLDESGEPVVGATVSPVYFFQDRNFGSWDRAVSDRWTTKTDADGYATLADLPQGYSTLLNVDDERFAQPDYHSNIALAKAAQTPDQIIHLVRGGSITGQVLYGPTRKPAANVLIQAVQNGDDSTGQGGAKTDTNGRYKIARLPAGTYTLTLFSDRAHPQPWTAAAKTATVSGGAVSSANFTLIRGALLTGIVKDKSTGKPLPNITIMVNGPANPQAGRGAGMAFTGPDGRYRLRVPPGSQRLLMAGVADASPQDFKVVDGETKTLNFQVASPAPPVVPRPVAGTVLGPDGKPVAGAEVVATNESTQERKTTTDAQGRFAFDEGLLPKARLLARSGDLATPKGIAADGKNMTLRLEPNALVSFEGQVTDQDGKPLANAKIGLVRWQTNMGTDAESTQTDAGGHYVFPPDYSDAPYSIRAEAPGYGSKYSDHITGIAGKTLAVPTLAAVRADSFVAGTVVDPQGKPVSGAQVSDREMSEAHTITDAQGRFRLENVPRGKTVIEVHAPENRWTAIQVASGGSDSVLKVSSEAENEAEGKRFQKMLAADTTNHGDGTDAHVLLQTAQARARSEGKKVFLVFHASWCGPCFLLHRFLDDPQIKPIIDAHFVVQDLDIWEHGKNKWENPGGVDIYKQYGGPNSVPFFVVTDAAGKKLGDAMHNGDNMGMPTQPDDVQFFLQTLQAAAPSLTGAEVAALKSGLQKHAAL